MFFFKLEQTPSVGSHRVLSPLYSTGKMSRSAFSHVLGHHKCMPGTRFNTGMQECHPAPYPEDAENSDVRRSSNMFWLVVSTYPSEKWWSESQLGWLFHSQLFLESHSKFHGSKAPTSIHVLVRYIYHKPQNSGFYRFQSPPMNSVFQDELTGPSPFTSPRPGLPGQVTRPKWRPCFKVLPFEVIIFQKLIYDPHEL